VERGRSLDKLATRLILDGFIAYGWTYSELSKIRSKVLDQLVLYVDLSLLALQRGVEDVLADDNIACLSYTTPTNNPIDEGLVTSEQWSYYCQDNLSTG
jgi:hypothetical protein